MSPTHTSDVLVVGGGIIGLVTAWRAAQRGFATAVVDPDPGGGAAQVAAGMLAAVTELHYGEQTLLGLNLASARRYPDFAAELTEATGHDLGYRRCGTLAVALDADDRAQLRELHALQRRSGLESEWLNGRECRRLEPMLAPGVRGGSESTAITRSIRAGSPRRWWWPASAPGWSSTGCGPSACSWCGAGPPGS
ncbi:hypothetical protein SAV31267_029450 [Streptomyces avermitilis]|uniref:FAD dependent oxidoreductase domain-containing protein n=1 Tax=Streptomyces avermitilis TaxID=33903 RepID=A0A4D4MN36_STRAX|nr:hypothetical protein SAV31267_029450 [Streptomyces avermitilis]